MNETTPPKLMPPDQRAAAKGTSGSKSGQSSSSAAAAAGLTPALAAQGYTVVNGQVVRKLGSGGPNQFMRANALVAATSKVASPEVLVYLGWALLVMGLLLAPPLVAMRINRKRQLAALGADAAGRG